VLRRKSTIRPRRAQSPLPERASRSPLLIGIVLSVALATVLALVTSTTVLLGVCAGLLGTVLALVYDLLHRFERRIEVEDQRSVLMAAVDDTPWLLTDLRDIATSAKSVLNRDRTALLFVDLMRAELGDTRAFLQDLNRGQIRVPAGDVTPMSNQIDLVQSSVFATTIPENDNEWWLSVAGRDYLARNGRAVSERDVTVERIVLWGEGSPALARMVAEQREAGVRLLFARRSELPDNLKTSTVIYDEAIYHDVVFNADGVDIYYEYYLDASDVQRAVARFNSLKRLSTAEVPAELASWLERPEATLRALAETDAPDIMSAGSSP
jgi:hypothetical protein